MSAPVVKMMISNAAIDEDFIEMMTFLFQPARSTEMPKQIKNETGFELTIHR